MRETCKELRIGRTAAWMEKFGMETYLEKSLLGYMTKPQQPKVLSCLILAVLIPRIDLREGKSFAFYISS